MQARADYRPCLASVQLRSAVYLKERMIFLAEFCDSNRKYYAYYV